MCLITLSSEQVADKDILCYKILMRRTNYFVSPYLEYRYDIPSTVEDTTEENILKTIRSYKIVSSGFLHAFRTYIAATHWKEAMQGREPYTSFVIAECIIPAGTRYYFGTNGDICSKKLKLVKII
jgi:hypothetical protein